MSYDLSILLFGLSLVSSVVMPMAIGYVVMRFLKREEKT